MFFNMGDLLLRRQSFCYLTIFLLAIRWVSPAPTEVQTQVSESHNDVLPPHWQLAPGNLEDYPIQDNKIVINPWNYLHRLGMYKILLHFSAKYFTGLGPNNVGNILWGLPLQHGWQYRTGRLADILNVTTYSLTNGDNFFISSSSWWSCMNYYLSAVPFLGALDSGFFGELPYAIELQPPDVQRTDFCLSTAECNTQISKTMAAWRDFFKYLLSTASDSGTPSGRFSEDIALKYIWNAHVLSIDAAKPKCENRLSYYSGPERNFGVAWSTTVDFLAAMRIPTNLNFTNHFQTGLPPRMLMEGDKAPFILDFTYIQNKVLFVLTALHRINENTGNIPLLLWKWAMSTEEGRRFGRSLLEIFFGSNLS